MGKGLPPPSQRLQDEGDSSGLQERLVTTNRSSRRCAVDKLVGCCNDYHLLFNVSKTKEIAVDFKRDSSQRVKTHRCAVKKLVGWGKDYHLLLNVSKTEETVFAFRRDPTQLPDHLSSTKRKQRSWAPTATPSWTGPRTQGQRQPPPFQHLQDQRDSRGFQERYPPPPHSPTLCALVINGEEVAIVGEYRYLGSNINTMLDWTPNARATSGSTS